MKIALGVTGGIACYKAAEILRRLQDRGHDVHVAMTKGATQFVAPLTFRALSGNKVYLDIFEGATSDADPSSAYDHIFLAQDIALFLIAPATADSIARMAAGLADDFLTTFYLAVQSPVVVAPAMNTRMWEHSSVQENVRRLEARGVRIIPPDTGRMACNTYGPGRLAEVETIVDVVSTILSRSQDLKGRRLLVTAGPTVEDIDPVRFISNRSSGKMGFSIARAARDRGAEVTLISGPSTLSFPGVVRVRSTAEMHEQVMAHFGAADAVVMAAAPLDFRPRSVASQKIKKSNAARSLELEPTPDILEELGRRKNGKVLAGFAAETEDFAKNAQAKLKAKNLDLIVVNPVGGPDSGFDTDTNQASIIDASGAVHEIPLTSKAHMADTVLDRVAALLASKK
jgi:phosphopantothenoylcysteine decarboxylase/phosphopantothenate--cysteine ligase